MNVRNLLSEPRLSHSRFMLHLSLYAMQPKPQAGASMALVQRPGELSRPTDRAAVPQVAICYYVSSGLPSHKHWLAAMTPRVRCCWAQHGQGCTDLMVEWQSSSLMTSGGFARQATRLEVFGPQDADGFQGLGLTKALADHLEGELGSWAAYYAVIVLASGQLYLYLHVSHGHAGTQLHAAN